MKKGVRSAPRTPSGSQGIGPVSPDIMPRAIKAKDVARRFGVDTTTVYQWVRSGRLIGHKVGGRVLIPVTAVEALLPAACTNDCPCTCHRAA